LRRALHSKIADRFVDEQRRGNEDLGLEIAWHCMRAGRPREATGFLLCGAREAMHKGAVHAAERALSSARDHLAPAQRTEAMLLLAEILQEQGRWVESLEVLEKLVPYNRPLVTVLSIMAECRSTFLPPEQLRTRLSQLRNIIETSDDVRIRVKAANVLAFPVAVLREAQLASDLLRCIEEIPLDNLCQDDLACVATCKARLTYCASGRPPKLTAIYEIVERLQSDGYVNSTMGSLHTGIGTVLCCEGKYADAKVEFLRAHDIYAGLGNDSSSGAQAAQIALCCFRLGEYREAIQWSQNALRSIAPQFSGYFECMTGLYSGGSYAILGDYKNAMEAVERVDVRLSDTVPAWMKQAWGLHKADIQLMLGQVSKACHTAREALGPGRGLLYSSFFGGPFARWTALIARVGSNESEAMALLSEMTRTLDTYDTMDQVEILCARGILQRRLPSNPNQGDPLIQEKLAHLPPAVTEQLTRLRMLARHPEPALIGE
jgi:tetratricopeptide (TPR) repeat protein